MSSRKYIVNDYPSITKEYNNEKNVVPVDEIYVGYPVPVWWICENGHEWQALVKNRAVRDHGCIYCTGQVPIVGENDLSTTDPLLAKEWHPSKNGEFTPQIAMRGSSKKVWWVCNNGHEWEAVIYSRANGSGCPYCSGRLAIRGKNDLETLHKDIASEWHPIKNGKLKPYQFKEKSTKKVWWQCKEGHEWNDSICERVSDRKKCPFCNNTVVIPDKNSFKALEPEAASYWDYDSNGDLKPENFFPHSNKEVNWICGKHKWNEKIGSMTKRKECPYCSGARISEEDSVFNKYPLLLIELDHDKNVGININSISEGSSKMIWWKCKKGHSWLAPTERRVKGSKCPYCAGKKSIYSI
ncbi:zinc-ribbon domain-containing protein [Paenibacillus sp. FSL R5-0407]|uniref:zinc-ribbon domain-containing protein n=1 Tax=Paenibacillus sp. FSL R5-0407 TaxID=2975320 RepID=UPI0030F9BC2F